MTVTDDANLVTLDLPGKLPPNISELADEMTDQEMKALLIVQTRLIQELVDKARRAEEAIEKMSTGGMLGRMMGGKNPAKSGNPAVRNADPMAQMKEQARQMGITIPGMPD